MFEIMADLKVVRYFFYAKKNQNNCPRNLSHDMKLKYAERYFTIFD